MLLPLEPAPAEPLPVVELGLLEVLPELELPGELLVLPLELDAPFASSQRCFSRPVRVVQSEAELYVLEPEAPLDGALELDEPVEGELDEPADGVLLEPLEPLTPLPDDDCAKEAAENASSAEAVAEIRSFNVIDFS